MAETEREHRRAPRPRAARTRHTHRGARGGRARAHRPHGRLLLALTVFVMGCIGASVAAWQRDRACRPAVAARLYPLASTAGDRPAARGDGVDPYLVAAVVKTESGFDARASRRPAPSD